MSRKFIIAGGGTGGHIFPAVAIAQAIRKLEPTAQFLFIGAKGKMEMEKVPQAGFEIVGLDIAGFNRSSLIKNIGLPFKLLKSFMQVRSVFSRFLPDAVIGVGGYSTFPVLKYAQGRGIPTFIHEANSFAGKSNILLGKKATKVFTATTGMERFFPAAKIMVTGNPVRAAIKQAAVSRNEALASFGLEPQYKTVLVVGGSLGARSINQAVGQGLTQLLQHNVQLIWQTGKSYLPQAKQEAADCKTVWVNDFISNMEVAYAAADVVVSRAGAMSIAELCLVGRPAVLVPYPHAAEDHQTANARQLVAQQAALLVPDAQAATDLIPVLLELIKDETTQQQMRQQISRLGVADADEVVAKEILKMIA